MCGAAWHAQPVPAHEDTAQEIAASGGADKALDLVFDQLDDLILGDRFEECAAILCAVEPTQLPPAVAVGFLAITRPADDQLRDVRAALRRRIEATYRNTMSPVALEQLLRGL